MSGAQLCFLSALFGWFALKHDFLSYSLKGLEVAIRNKIEQDVTHKASLSMHKPLNVVKGAEGKGKPGAAGPAPSSK